MQSAEDARQALRWLVVVRWVALADLILLVVLLAASFADHEEMVSVFGLVHGIVFLVLLAIIGFGSLEKLWSWWFLVGTAVTTGPPGAFVGEVLIARKARSVIAEEKENQSSRTSTIEED
ncbi:MAG: DUF3817 domain-containing protein [Chloroflexota bacterium]